MADDSNAESLVAEGQRAPYVHGDLAGARTLFGVDTPWPKRRATAR